MTSENYPIDAIRAARKLLGNQYAYIEYLEAPEEPAPARSTLHLSENPYATLAQWDGNDAPSAELAGETVPTPVVALQQTFREFLSKADFRSECIRIFMPYVPPYQAQRIPQHQKDFIARNERRSGKARYRLVEAIRRYDLSTTPGIRPQFNREHPEDLSERKLRQIEAQVGDKD